MAGDRPPPFQLRCLPVKGGARFRRQGHLGRLRHRRQPRRPRGHEQPSPARHHRDARGRSRPRDRARQQRARRWDFGLHYIGLSGTDVTDKVDGLSVDGELSFDAGSFTSLQFGAASTGRSKTRDTIENDTNGGSCIYCNLYGVTFVSLGAQAVHSLSLPNFMRNFGGRHLTGSYFDVHAVPRRDSTALDGQPILDEDGNPTGEVYDSSLVAPEFNPAQSYDVDEDTLAGYSAPTSARTAGSRTWACATSTPTRRRGPQSTASCAWTTRRPSPDLSPDVTYSPAEPLKENGSYSKLPFLDVGWWPRRTSCSARRSRRSFRVPR